MIRIRKLHSFLRVGIAVLLFLSTLTFPQPAHAAAINHTFVEVNTIQTTTSTSFVDVPGVAIASGSFTAGKKYLLYLTAIVGNSGGNGTFTKLLHGTTDFAESLVGYETSTINKSSFGVFTVWTAVSGEGIKLQFKSNTATPSANIDHISLVAMNLSDDLTENTDWFYNEVATDSALSTTFLDGGAVTFTPGTAGHDWLVLSYANIDPGDTTTQSISRINRSGEAASSLPQASYEVPFSDKFNGFQLARVFNLGAASNTFKEQSATSSGTAHVRLHSSIFVLNLNKFSNHAFAYTEADASLSATNYATQLQTLSITPSVASDVWIGSYWGFDRNNSAREGESRVQVDNTDQPAGHTTANYQFHTGGDATDEEPEDLSTMVNLSAAAHTVDLDASADSTTGAPAGQHRTLWAVTMELAGGAPPPRKRVIIAKTLPVFHEVHKGKQ